jgi:hypothetical protein
LPTEVTIYWSSPGGSKIQRAEPGGAVENLATLGGSPLSLVVDLGGNKIYWSEPGTGLIRRANLDGSNSQTIGATGFPGDSHAQHIAVDFGAGKVYWAEPESPL